MSEQWKDQCISHEAVEVLPTQGMMAKLLCGWQHTDGSNDEWISENAQQKAL